VGFYRLKVRLLKEPRIALLWRRAQGWLSMRARRPPVGDYGRLPDLVREHASGATFADIGCMWGVNGEYAFVAEEAGATEVTGVDVFGPTDEFEEKRRERGSSVRFVLGDITSPQTLEQVGQVDVVLCAGVLYHHPSPFDVLAGLRRICRRTLILRTWAIPEVEGLPNAGVFFPMLSPKARRLWDLSRHGLNQVGIAGPFEPDAGYGNWFWGLSPSCIRSLLETAGFRVDRQLGEEFAQTFICTAVEPPFAHRLPDEREARAVGHDVSAAGIARPA